MFACTSYPILPVYLASAFSVFWHPVRSQEASTALRWLANLIFQESFWLSIELFCFGAIQCLVLDTRNQKPLALATCFGMTSIGARMSQRLEFNLASVLVQDGLFVELHCFQRSANRTNRSAHYGKQESTECSSSGCLVARVVPARFWVGNPADD